MSAAELNHVTANLVSARDLASRWHCHRSTVSRILGSAYLSGRAYVYSCALDGHLRKILECAGEGCQFFPQTQTSSRITADSGSKEGG